MTINVKSLFLSGIITGIIILIVGGGLVPIIGNQMDEVLKSRLLPPLSYGAMIFFAFCSIINGIGSIGLYVLIKNSVKSRLRAIIITSLLFWFFVYFLANSANVAYGFMPLKLTVIGTIWGLLEFFLGVLVGSKLYREVKNIN